MRINPDWEPRDLGFVQGLAEFLNDWCLYHLWSQPLKQELCSSGFVNSLKSMDEKCCMTVEFNIIALSAKEHIYGFLLCHE